MAARTFSTAFLFLNIFVNWINAFVILPTTNKNSYLKLHQPKDEESPVESNLSRRNIILAIGGAAYAKSVATAVSRLRRGDAYPPDHESRVAGIFKRSLVEASSSQSSNNDRLRVLEVGIGSSCRTIIRGLYDDALTSVAELGGVNGVDFVGVDIDTPSENTLNSAKERLNGIVPSLPVSLNVMNANIEEGLPFQDGYFDVITCSLVLCSVSEQTRALKEMKRVLNRKGGTFGYVEHVAVNLENDNEKDSRSFLEFQQRLLDPLQQSVAHNCHLHRDTDHVIASVFGSDSSSPANVLETERFFVDDMWPIVCQCCGVVKLVG